MTVTELSMDFEPRGRRTSPLEVRTVGEVTESDLALLATNRGTKPRQIQKLRDRHHALARALANGLSDADASAITGYEPSRISILRSDPAFKELLHSYRDIKDGHFADFQERAALVTLEATNILADRLEESPEEIGTGQVLDIIKTLADRTGHAPVAKSVQLNATVDLSDRLNKARKRVLDVESKVLSEAAVLVDKIEAAE